MAAGIYNTLRFVFKVEFIRPDLSHFNNRSGDTHWIPPSLPDAVETWASTGWRRWTSTGISPAAAPQPPDIHNICSLFYNSETFSFMGVPYDCRWRSVKAERDATGHGWRRLTFTYTDDNPPLSVIGLDTEHLVLASRGSPAWMPELVPPTYNHNMDRFNGPIANRTGLAGELPIILGMAALSSAPPRAEGAMAEYISSVIENSFHPPEWRTHRIPTGRNHATGVVVSVAVDPTAPGISADVLKSFQKGEYGPILR